MAVSFFFLGCFGLDEEKRKGMKDTSNRTKVGASGPGRRVIERSKHSTEIGA